MRSRGMKLMAAGLVAAGMVLAGAGGAAAAVKILFMDAFKPTFQPLPGGAYGRFYPGALGGRTPVVTLNNYGGCARLRLPAGSQVTEIKYQSEGTGGWSQAFLDEYQYGQDTSLATDYVPSYPTLEREKTLHDAASPPIPIRRGRRYYVCVEGVPGAVAGSYNQFYGFKVTYTKP